MNMATNIARLVGKDVNLCVFRTDDEALVTYTKWMADENINAWISHNTQVISFNAERKWLNTEDENLLRFNIVEKNTDKLIGNCSIEKKPNTRNASLGICIGEEVGRDKGYGTEVIRLLIKFCFNELNIHRVFLTLNAENKRALQCYKNAGMQICGVGHEAGYYNGHYCDVIEMEILEQDWRALRKEV